MQKEPLCRSDGPDERNVIMSNYVKRPLMTVANTNHEVCSGFAQIVSKLKQAVQGGKRVLTVECYPGVNQEALLSGLSALGFAGVIHSDDLAFEPKKMDALLECDMTDDRVFGVMTTRVLQDYFYAEKIEAARAEIARVEAGLVLVYGVGASLVHPGDVLVVADLTRWEIQLRYRRGLNNWRTAKGEQSKSAKYKRGFFAEWRWADKVKKQCLPKADFYLDATNEAELVMVDGQSYRDALAQLATRPFRMAPYFDPGVWGGDWMKAKFDLPENGSNYAWSFDGVPEENSLLLAFGDTVVETPAINLVFMQPRALLGQRVYARFGAEFPIRFDLLDTIHGQNLSLQVHPLTDYVQEHFNMRYTQDESYYILDVEGEDTNVWIGLQENVDKAAMAAALYAAQNNGVPFEAENYANKIPVKKHDHVLIPAGTVHCSAANTMVLEISATPYIFTFKMWDWARTDLDGTPRPIHIDHALKNIQWDRDLSWVQKNLIHQDAIVTKDETTTVERTGLHALEFIDTYRITTTGKALIERDDSVHMLNLVEGESAQITSPTNAFAPFEVHYAETFVVPQNAGAYEIVAPKGTEIKMIMACVRP